MKFESAGFQSVLAVSMGQLQDGVNAFSLLRALCELAYYTICLLVAFEAPSVFCYCPHSSY